VGDAEGAARRLLRALDENQAHDREGGAVQPVSRRSGPPG